MPTIYFQQFGNEPDYAPAFFEAIGRNAVLWGRLEVLISSTILIVTAHPDATFPRPDTLPNAFSAKIKLWRELFRNEPVVADMCPRALRFARLATPIARRRNELIHSAIGHFAPTGPGTAKAEVVTRKNARTHQREIQVLQKDLDQLIEQIIDLHNWINPIVMHSHLRTISSKRERDRAI